MESLNEDARKKEMEVRPCKCSTGLVICICAYQWQGNKEKVGTHEPIRLWQAAECLMEFSGAGSLLLPESALQ